MTDTTTDHDRRTCDHDWDEWQQACITELPCGHDWDEWRASCARCMFVGCQECHIWDTDDDLLCENCQKPDSR